MKKNPHIKEDPDTFITNNMSLAKSVARRIVYKLYSQGAEADDIFSMAYIGLCKAYEKFNPFKFKVKFSTYAVPVITSEICNNIRDHYDLVSIPRPIRETRTKIKKAGYTIDDNPKEISKKLNIPLELVADGMKIFDESYLIDSLDRVIFDNEDKKMLVDTIVDNTKEVIDEEIIINDFLSLLSDKMMKVYDLRFKQNMSQREVSEIIGCGQVSVSRIEKKIFDLAKMYCSDVAC